MEPSRQPHSRRPRGSESRSPLYFQEMSTSTSNISAFHPAIATLNTVARMQENARDEDAILVERTRNGDTEAFDRLVKKYTQRLYGLVYNMTSNHEDTNDLLQDIFAKSFRSIKKFQGKSSFYTWLYSIAVNMTINYLKKHRRRRGVSLDDVDSGIHNDKDFLELTNNSTNTPFRNTGLHELQKRLNEAMQKLSENHRTVVSLFDIQGLPHAEISKILGVSEGTVRSRLFYAHRQLQAYLGDLWEERER